MEGLLMQKSGKIIVREIYMGYTNPFYTLSYRACYTKFKRNSEKRFKVLFCRLGADTKFYLTFNKFVI